ncbi:hypothetical protein PR002_g5311 [Phytophthora rubi]|uniref:Uncharacterized protein n=1 Tax=Phytophthora rubi TaxID=129364 RepID=A0A6A3NET0_9STRA|nr:hypothetical protein PR002_g5311 [Phytophthora rubi]
MTDPEMSSVWRFVAETNLDEIFSGTVTSDSATGGANETSVAIKTELTAVSINSDTSSEASYDDKTSVASFNSDEISEGGDSDEDAKRVINAPTKAEIKRLKQQAYDKRYREKMKVKKNLVGQRFRGCVEAAEPPAGRSRAKNENGHHDNAVGVSRRGHATNCCRSRNNSQGSQEPAIAQSKGNQVRRVVDNNLDASPS